MLTVHITQFYLLHIYHLRHLTFYGSCLLSIFLSMALSCVNWDNIHILDYIFIDPKSVEFQVDRKTVTKLR